MTDWTAHPGDGPPEADGPEGPGSPAVADGAGTEPANPPASPAAASPVAGRPAAGDDPVDLDRAPDPWQVTAPQPTLVSPAAPLGAPGPDPQTFGSPSGAPGGAGPSGGAPSFGPGSSYGSPGSFRSDGSDGFDGAFGSGRPPLTAGSGPGAAGPPLAPPPGLPFSPSGALSGPPLHAPSPEKSPGGGGRGMGTKVAAVAVAVAAVAALGFGIGRVSAGDGSGGTGSSKAASGSATTTSPGRSASTTGPGQSGASSSTVEPNSSSKGPTATSAPPSQPNTKAPDLDNSLEPAAAVNKAVSPAVVQIETGSGLGSGFIYDSGGYILTAAHVVEGDRQVKVRLASGDTHTGTVVGADTNNDVAVVKMDPRADLPTVALALNEAPVVGQTAIAIGSPFGLDQTVTQGIVSAVGRPVQTGASYVNMIQTDAAINSGNSGGPLVNRTGKVIGINVQIRTNTGDNAGIGFAVPIDLAFEVAQSLIAGKPIELGYLGVASSADPTEGRTGALLTRVEAGSPAAQAGLQVGDLVTAIDGKLIKDFTALAATIRSTKPGQKVQLSIERNGQKSEVTVTVGKASR